MAYICNSITEDGEVGDQKFKAYFSYVEGQPWSHDETLSQKNLTEIKWKKD